MALLFDHDIHAYTLDGTRLPSVTGILRDQGLIHFNGVPPTILEAARRRGSAVHALIHYDNENDLDETSVDENWRAYLEAWRACRAERHIVCLLCERRLASRRHRVCGTLDLLCEIDGDGWLLDYATGDPDHVAKHLQTAGYLGLALEWAVEDAELGRVLSQFPRWRRASVRLRRTGMFVFREYTDTLDYTRFQILAAAWHIRQEEGGIVVADALAA